MVCIVSQCCLHCLQCCAVVYRLCAEGHFLRQLHAHHQTSRQWVDLQQTDCVVACRCATTNLGKVTSYQYCQFDCVCTAAADWPCVAAAPQLIASHNAYSIQKCHTCASCKHRHLQTLLCCSYTNTLSCSLQSKQRKCGVQVGSANLTPKRSAKLLYIAMLTGTG